MADMAAWQNRTARPRVRGAGFDAIVVKACDSQVANRPTYVAIGVDLQGEGDVLGMWLGPAGGEGATQWATMPAELRNRGLADASVRVLRRAEGIALLDPGDLARSDGADLVSSSWVGPEGFGVSSASAEENQCRPTQEVRTRFAQLAGDWEDAYPAMIRSWRQSWDEFVPFGEFRPELCRVVYTTDEIVKCWCGGVGAASGRRGLRRRVLVARRGLSRRLAAV